MLSKSSFISLLFSLFATLTLINARGNWSSHDNTLNYAPDSCTAVAPANGEASASSSSSSPSSPSDLQSDVYISTFLTLTRAAAATTLNGQPSSTVQQLYQTGLSSTACSFWLEDINHQGIAPYSGDSSYQIFRNVKDFGAVGDGVTDDTAAINAAISSGNRCAPGTCASSSVSPAIVYFPEGTYLVSTPIIDYYYTQIIGNPNCLPAIKASGSFSGSWIIDGDPYGSGGNLGWGSTNVFWRQIRNFVIDFSAVSPSQGLYGIHWPTGQATSLQNIQFQMSAASGTQHIGLFIESGSGGFVTDLTFNGGLYGMSIGNQQFTMRNLQFFNAVTAINQIWDWGWTYQGITIENCQTGLNIAALNNGAQSVGSVTFIDSSISNTPVGISTARIANSQPPAGGSLILENVQLNNVATAVQGSDGSTILAGTFGQTTISAWGQGHEYTPNGPTSFQGPISSNTRPSSLLSGSEFFTQSKPQYESNPVSSFLSVRDAGAKGDGTTDDTAALQAVIQTAAASGQVVFFDAGYYVVTNTLYIPAGSKIVGESYPVILSSGSVFADINNPQPVVRIGNVGETGSVAWSDMLVSTRGAQAGAILIQWNLASPTSSPSGLWDVHTRIGGFVGSNLQLADCPKTPDSTITASSVNANCIAAFASMHVATGASGLYMENNWLWTADHDVDDPNLTQITIYSGRGLLIESANGPTWLYGTAVEHHTLYQYQLSNTQALYMGQIQTETPYYQPNPPAPAPFPTVSDLNDPVFSGSYAPTSDYDSAWGLRVLNSHDILIYGAGLYSFFTNYDVNCSNQGNGETCQEEILSVDDTSTVSLYNLNTVGVTNMVTLNGQDIASYADNLDGFVDTIALFRTANYQ